MFNGFGFRVNKKESKCFGSYQEVRQKVENWIKEKAEKGYTLGEMLCYYNQGIKTENCEYFKHYLTLR